MNDPLTLTRYDRRTLAEAVGDLAAASNATPSLPLWRASISGALADVKTLFELHVAQMEAEGGLYEDIMNREPRLAHRITVLRADHLRIRAAMRAAKTAIERDRPFPVIQEEIFAVIEQVQRHQQRSADLIWEAYGVDVAAKD